MLRTFFNPGASAGTMIIDARSYGSASGSVTTIAMRKSAIMPFDVNHLWPLMTHSSPSNTAVVVRVEHFERVHLVVHEAAHPLELLLELGLGGEIPGHSREIPSSIMPTMVDVSPSYMGSGRRPLRCSIRLYPKIDAYL